MLKEIAIRTTGIRGIDPANKILLIKPEDGQNK